MPPIKTSKSTHRVSQHTACRFTPQDQAHAMAIADAMRLQGLKKFPTQAAAVRYALLATATALKATGCLPVFTSQGPQVAA